MLAAGAGAIVVGVLLARALAGRGADFVEALHMAPLVTLAVVTILQSVALVARSEAWAVCRREAGADPAYENPPARSWRRASRNRDSAASDSRSSLRSFAGLVSRGPYPFAR